MDCGVTGGKNDDDALHLKNECRFSCITKEEKELVSIVRCVNAIIQRLENDTKKSKESLITAANNKSRINLMRNMKKQH